jgi:hypothetical protein
LVGRLGRLPLLNELDDPVGVIEDGAVAFSQVKAR